MLVTMKEKMKAISPKQVQEASGVVGGVVPAAGFSQQGHDDRMMVDQRDPDGRVQAFYSHTLELLFDRFDLPQVYVAADLVRFVLLNVKRRVDRYNEGTALIDLVNYIRQPQRVRPINLAVTDLICELNPFGESLGDATAPKHHVMVTGDDKD
jgi:hypothetical protein